MAVWLSDRINPHPSTAAISQMQQNRSLPLEHWGLERWPFRNTPDLDQLYPTATHNEALARIDYLVEGRRRLGVLLGGPGVGKSLVLQAASRQLARQGRATVVVDALAVSPRELLWLAAARFGASPREDADLPQLWRLLADRVHENRLQRIHTVLFIDDAGQAGPDLVSQLIRLARLDTHPSARWTIILAAQPGQALRWSDSLRDLVDLRVDLGPWSKDETIGYVQTALVEAGRLEPLFDDEAIESLHEMARGVPRDIVRLADFALLAGAAANLETIDLATVENAYDEIAWPAAEPANAY
jgi:general secretion pathway protein A